MLAALGLGSLASVVPGAVRNSNQSAIELWAAAQAANFGRMIDDVLIEQLAITTGVPGYMLRGSIEDKLIEQARCKGNAEEKILEAMYVKAYGKQLED